MIDRLLPEFDTFLSAEPSALSAPFPPKRLPARKKEEPGYGYYEPAAPREMLLFSGVGKEQDAEYTACISQDNGGMKIDTQRLN